MEKEASRRRSKAKREKDPDFCARSEKEQNTFECTKCPSIFARRDRLKRHMESVHEQMRFPCDFCDHVATRRDRLKAHIQKAHCNPNGEVSTQQWDQQAAANMAPAGVGSRFSHEGNYGMRIVIIITYKVIYCSSNNIARICNFNLSEYI